MFICISRPPPSVTPLECRHVWCRKSRMTALPGVKICLAIFDTDYECERQTDRLTNRIVQNVGDEVTLLIVCQNVVP